MKKKRDYLARGRQPITVKELRDALRKHGDDCIVRMVTCLDAKGEFLGGVHSVVGVDVAGHKEICVLHGELR
jgi:hypothetical protein